MKEVSIDYVQTVEDVRLFRLTVDGAVLLRRAPLPTALRRLGEICEGEEARRGTLL